MGVSRALIHSWDLTDDIYERKCSISPKNMQTFKKKNETQL